MKRRSFIAACIAFVCQPRLSVHPRRIANVKVYPYAHNPEWVETEYGRVLDFDGGAWIAVEF